MIKVSCVLPVYNGISYLRTAVESVLNQDYRDFELILIDDGSGDGSGELCEYFAQTDHRVKVIRQANKGIVASLNLGIGLARGEYIARMDADDVCKSGRFAAQVEYMDNHPEVVVLGSRCNIIDGNGKFHHATRGNAWRSGPNFPSAGIALCHPTVFFRREHFLRTRGYSETFHAAEDFALWIDFSRLGLVVELPEYLLDYRVHDASVSYIKLLAQRVSCLKAELAYQAREIAGDTMLASKIEEASTLDAILSTLPRLPGRFIPSARAVLFYFNAQVVKRQANRGKFSEGAATLIGLARDLIFALPTAYSRQDRSTIAAGLRVCASIAWAILRRTNYKT